MNEDNTSSRANINFIFAGSAKLTKIKGRKWDLQIIIIHGFALCLLLHEPVGSAALLSHVLYTFAVHHNNL